ncbi:serine aminopeptidase domain-containing protein [Pseudooceanicola sp. MF1-13]|uniref:serine aminopeptidase domain-containing protein n=1 Tax=Pseudooceanicola sp. MF1-13 TaxID=3379095 RepID=UPI0038922D2F
MAQNDDHPEIPEQRSQLIESIYRIALDPQSYDAFMENWDGFVAQRAGRSADQPPISSELETHFALANKLLEETMPPPTSDGEAQIVPGENRSAPRFLIDARGRIVWFNAAAERMFGFRRNDTADRLPLSDDRMDRLTDMIAAIGQPGGGRTLRPQVFSLGPDTAERPMHFQARVITEASGADLILISKLAASWPPGAARLLRDDFALTPSEIDICEWIADGSSAAQVADMRGASLATVRTQMKKIMAKTKTASQPELVRLLHLLIRIAEDNPDQAPLMSDGAGLKRIKLATGRVMPVEIHGPEGGTPVIFFHGMLDGNAITNHARDLLFDNNLCFYCPVRPWFGAADPDEGNIDTAPQRFAADVHQMIGELGLERPILLGHMGGALYAHAVAAAAPEGQIAGIVCVSGGVPIVSPDQFATMSGRQRVVAYTARYTPRILPFIVRAGIRQMRSGGERKFLMSLYENSPDDLPVVADPEVQGIVLNGYRFSVAQGHRAFEIDSRHVVDDWTDMVNASTAPIRIVHGESDPVVSCTSVKDFADRHSDRSQITTLPDIGQLLFYRRPDAVIDAIRSLRNQPQA